jgi:LysR family glycine cleavage system transcriptional activator
MWLITRLEAFQSEYPDIDIRIDATDNLIDLETADVDLALRYTTPDNVPQGAVRLFGEQLTAVASPWLLKASPPLRSGQDLAHFTLVEAGDSHRHMNLELLSWRRWFTVHHLEDGQGIALARMPLIADGLASGDLVEILPHMRLDSPLAYWMVVGPRSADRPEIKAFCAWLQLQAQVTRRAIGDGPDPDTVDHFD